MKPSACLFLLYPHTMSIYSSSNADINQPTLHLICTGICSIRLQRIRGITFGTHITELWTNCHGLFRIVTYIDQRFTQSIDRSSVQPEALMRKRVLFSFTLSQKMKLQIYSVWPALFSS